MKYRNKIMLIVLLIICIAFCAYKYIPIIADFINRLYDGKYNAVLLPLVIIALIKLIGIFADKQKIITENVNQALKYDKESKIIIVYESKKGETNNEKR